MTTHTTITSLPKENLLKEPMENVTKNVDKRSVKVPEEYLRKFRYPIDGRKIKRNMSKKDEKLLKKFQKVLHDIDSFRGTRKKRVNTNHHKRIPKALIKNFWKYPKVKQSVLTEDVHYKGDNYNSTNDTADVSQESAYSTDCLHPEYLVYTWVLSLIALATTLKLYFLIKTLLAVTMVAIYTLFILVFYPEVFSGVHSHR